MAAARLGVRADMASAIADAVPLDLLETEMARLTRAMADAEHQVTTANGDLASSEQTLEDALTVAGNCHRHYEAAPDYIKRQINQGFFRKLIIGTDGSVERAELTEPFAQLLTPDWEAATGTAQNAPDAPERLPAPRTPDETPRRPWAPWDAQGMSRRALPLVGQRKTPAMISSGLVHITNLWWACWRPWRTPVTRFGGCWPWPRRGGLTGRGSHRTHG